ncbi:hypothetical protein DRN67_02165 [Candidatus Micrarchaeota archaeon]|nr:MAG: hypothetical protein DRN67_02165 [Candidatus Micrarchaeota archaeon]
MKEEPEGQELRKKYHITTAAEGMVLITLFALMLFKIIDGTLFLILMLPTVSILTILQAVYLKKLGWKI